MDNFQRIGFIWFRFVCIGNVYFSFFDSIEINTNTQRKGTMSKLSNTQKIIANILANVHKKKWECVLDGCHENAINSHLLQQNGILDNVSVNGHLIEYKPIDPFRWGSNSFPFEMKRIGKKNAFSLPLFCNGHDTSIFKEIETLPLNLELYRCHLLLSYRVVCAEIRKKQINVEEFSRILKAESLKGEINLDLIKSTREDYNQGIKDLEVYKMIFETELKNQSSRFTFKVYKYPFLDIYGSAVFSPIDFSVVNTRKIKVLNSMFIHVVPYDGQTNIIVGYCNKYSDKWIRNYCNSWLDLDQETFERKLTKLFAAHIENWGMSPDLLEEIKDENLQRFKEYTFKNVYNHSPFQIVDFNLFEYDD